MKHWARHNSGSQESGEKDQHKDIYIWRQRRALNWDKSLQFPHVRQWLDQISLIKAGHMMTPGRAPFPEEGCEMWL